MLIIKGVNIFPSDVEAVVRKNANLSGEYRLLIDRIDHLDRLTVEIESIEGYNGDQRDLAAQVSRHLKSVTGVTATVSVLAPGTLPRATHKAKRVLDRRSGVWG